MRFLIILTLGLAFTVGTSAKKVIGGSLTSIDRYPFVAALLVSSSGSGIFQQSCGGSIINNRSILTAAHCFLFFHSTNQWRARVGSSYWNSGGVVFTINIVFRHSSFSTANLDNDIAIIRINGAFSFNTNVQAGSIAGANYNIADNASVRVVGWGVISWQGQGSVQLRHVTVWIVNQAVCRSRYAELGLSVTDNMLCSGYLDVGGRDGCQGDSGGPVVHNGIIVGITSWGQECALPRYPGVNVRVSRYTKWIQDNK